MKRIGLLIIIVLTFHWVLSLGQEVYQWMDENGTIHFADDLSLIPERYRSQVQKKENLAEPSPLPSPQTIQKEERQKNPESDSGRKDLLGRGEEWWRNRAKEWNEKLLNANKDYDTAYAVWKAKEEELEQSKFKPKSFQRKLKAEIKVLEEKVKECEKQKEEAKNMLEKGLPKEAVEYDADPDWVKIEE